LERKHTLQLGNKVVIIWTKKHHFVELNGTFQAYVKGSISDNTPLFKTNIGDITGENCFWIEANKVNSSDDILRYQSILMPLQVELAGAAYKSGEKFQNKINYKEMKKLAEQKIEQNNRLKHFIDKFGFDPADDSWIEAHMATNDIESKWFSFTRLHKMPIVSDGFVELFNQENGEKVTYDEAIELTTKKLRYILGAQVIRQKGIADPSKWKEAALEFEKKFRKKDERMREWKKSKNGRQIVTTNKPIEFWPGSALIKCIEKIPHLFLSPDCDYIKAGVELEVLGFDPHEKWIKLDFPKEIKEQLGNVSYSIIVHPDNLDRLDDLDKL